MNHTIKGILIVAAVTSMLVVGATTMIPIMQNASARSTNINSNTNSADSSSSSTATASNTNDINNSATASQSQEQDACAVALTCPEGNTTLTSTPPPSTGTLQISKVCALCTSVVTFPITVTGNNPQPSSFTLSNGQTQAVTLGPGSFTVTESFSPKFAPTFTGDCKQTAPGSLEATGTISAGQNLFCTIRNLPKD
jgi:hypothetical protein